MPLKTWLVLFSCTLILAACGGGSSKDSGANGGISSGPVAGGFHLQTPKPLAVTPVLDATWAASAVIEVTGGVLTTTGADGATYTLQLPANALMTATLITMTPLTSLGGFAFDGGLQAAVQLEPDGLQLLQTATLTIVPSRSVPPAQQIGFGYHADGAEFHSEPLAVDSNIVFDVTHFSGYGAGQGGAANQAALTANPPTATIEQYQNAFAALFATERAAQLGGAPGDPNFASKVDALVQGFETDIVVPAIQTALSSTDLATVNNAIALVLGFLRDAQLLASGVDTQAVSTDLENLYQLQFKLAIAQDYDRCINQHDLSAIGDLLRYGRQAALLGNESVGDAAMQLLFKCARFELDIDSTFTTPGDGSVNPGITARVTSAIPMGIDISSQDIAASGVATYTGCSTSPPAPGSGVVGSDCTITTPTIELEMSLSLVTSAKRLGFYTDADLFLIPIAPATEIVINTHFEDGTTFTSPLPFWAALFLTAHKSEVTTTPLPPVQPGAIELRNWVKGSGSVLFTQTYSQTGAPLPGVTENSTFTIVHTPSP